MSTPRFRASRSRFFIGLGILILTMGFVAIFHSSQQQLDEFRQRELRCEQQQDSLNSQIVVYERSLKAARIESESNRNSLEKHAKELKDCREKSLFQSNLKLGALQQNFNILQTELNDLKDDSSKKDEQNQQKFNEYELKIKRLNSKNSQVIKEYQHQIDEAKTINQRIQKEKEILEKSLGSGGGNDDILTRMAKLKSKNYKLEQEIEQYKLNCPWKLSSSTFGNGGSRTDHHHSSSSFGSIDKNNNYNNLNHQLSKSKEQINNFNVQIPVSDNLYKIGISTTNNNNQMPVITATSINNRMINVDNNNNYNNNDGIGTGGGGFIGGGKLENEFNGPLNQRSINDNNIFIKKSKGIINSVENFQIMPKPLEINTNNININNNNNNNDDQDVLVQPPPAIDGYPSMSSTTTTTTMANINNKSSKLLLIDNKNLLNAPMPTATLGNKLKSSSTEAAAAAAGDKLNKKYRNLPEGVVPVRPNVPNDDIDENNNNNNLENSELPSISTNNNNINNNEDEPKENNRYANIVQDINHPNKGIPPQQPPPPAESQIGGGGGGGGGGSIGNDIDTGAQEVLDNDFMVDDHQSHKNHLINDDTKMNANNNNNNINNNNNAAEEDTNLYDKNINLLKSKMDFNENNEAMGDNRGDGGGGGGGNVGGGHQAIGAGSAGDGGLQKKSVIKRLNDKKLLNEINADQGNAYPDDAHIDGGLEQEEEEVDDDDYSNPLARNQDPPVRN